MNSDSDEESSLTNGEEGEDASDDDNNEEGIIEEENGESQQEGEDEENEETNNNFEEVLDEEKLDNIMLGKERKSNLRISDLLKLLKNKIILNKKNKKLSKLKINEITPIFFYNSWEESFKILDYKKDENFKKYIDLKQGQVSLEEMGGIVRNLLNGEKFSFFQKDPDNFENLI